MSSTISTRVIAVANRKGGVAKTTTVINLGAALAARRRRVLLVDLDDQQDLCSALKVPMPRPGLADALLSTAFFDTGNLAEAFVPVQGMVVAGGYGIGHCERELVVHGNCERALRRALAPHLNRFDYVLLDCAPSINSLTTNALTAAHDVLIPVQTEFLAANQLPSIMSAVDDIRSRLNASLKVAGFLPTMYDSRSRHALRMMEHIALQAHLWGVHAFKPIPKAVRLADAAEAGRPIFHNGSSSAPARAYHALAADIDGDREFVVELAIYDRTATPAGVAGSFA
ncbi:MAG TPA: ParA family protein [Vicinamibacteria bacterium]|nr:ParA family protein [Vicinamibacteria bacterium]